MTATATPPRAAASIPVDAVLRIRLAELHESPLNPRASYNVRALGELRDSLLSAGQLTPIIVRPRKTGGYELAAGHRRYRAAKLACESSPEGAKYRGLDQLTAVVRDLDDRTFIEVLNIENLQRDDLHPLEEATGFRQLMEQAGYDVAKIAARIGRSTKYVYDRIKLLQLVPEARRMFLAGEFEAGHAIILARLNPEEQKLAIDKENAEWSARKGGLFQVESAHGAPDPAEQEVMDLEDAVKPVSVREFQTWVDDNVRLTPDRIDPFLFPETAQLLAAAKDEELKVVHITHDYRVPDAARDEKQRTYGEHAWKRADGKHKSKTCDYAVVGVVVAGPGAGEAFRVCVRKDKCKTHWAAEQRQRAADRKHRQRVVGAHPSTSGYDPEKERAARAERDKERLRWKKAAPALAAALAEKFKQLPIARAIEIVLMRRSDPKSADKYLPRGQTPESVLRHLAFDLIHDDAIGVWNLAEIAPAELKPFGIDAKKIVDEIAPNSVDKKAAKTPAKKKAKK